MKIKILVTIVLSISISFIESKINVDLANNIHSYESITSYLHQLSKYYPDKVIVTSIGSTDNDLPIPIIKISSDVTSNIDKPAILIDACIHAREWITTAVALNLIQNLVEEDLYKHLIQRVDWYIIPIMNPDGYVYTQNEDRFWRKNLHQGRICDGVDLNRNFDFHFGQDVATRNECSINYPGPAAFSEPETQAFKNFIFSNDHNKKIKLYVSLHAYGQLVLYPYGVEDKQTSEAFEIRHKNLGQHVASAINSVRDSNYRSGKQVEILYAACGLSIDWMAAVAKIPLNYIIEISNKDVKFSAPRHEISPTFEEIFEGFKVFHKYVEKENGSLKERKRSKSNKRRIQISRRSRNFK